MTDYTNYGVFGENEKDIKKICFVGFETAYIEYNNGELIKVDLPVNEKKEDLEVVRLLRSAYPELKDDEIAELKNDTWYAYKVNTKPAKEVEKVYIDYIIVKEAEDEKAELEEKVEKANARARLAGFIATGGLIVGAIAFAHGCANKNAAPADVQTAIERTVVTGDDTEEVKESKNKSKVDLSNKTPEEVMKMLENGEINQVQATFFLNAYDWIKNNSYREEWQKLTLTDEEVAKANELLTSMGYEPLDGNEVRFNPTIEEAMGLMLRFGKYTNEELVAITGREEIPVEKIMGEYSNEGIRTNILYLVFSDEPEDKIEDLIKFSDEELRKKNEIADLWKEYKTLYAAEKYDEAEAKMKEVKNWLIDFASNAEFDKSDVKGYILRTYLYAALIMSNANNYQDTVSLHVTDSTTQEATDINVKLPLFDELTMRTLATGPKGFDQEAFKKEYGINSKFVLNDLPAVSKADDSCSAEQERLEAYNKYLNDLETKDIAAEAAVADQYGADISQEGVLENLDNANTTIDNLAKNTASMYDLAFAVDARLEEEGLTPKNMDYYRVVYLSNYIFAINVRVNPVLDYSTGMIIAQTVTETMQLTEAEAVAAFGEAAVEAAEEAAAGAVGAYDADDPGEAEAVAKQVANETAANLQAIYNALFNYYAGEAYFDINGDGNLDNNDIPSESYVIEAGSSTDELINTEATWAQEDGTQYKEDKAKDGQETGGEYTQIDYSDYSYDTGEAPEADTPVVEETVVTDPNQDQINQQVYDVQTASEYIGEDVVITNPNVNDNTYVGETAEDVEALLHN